MKKKLVFIGMVFLFLFSIQFMFQDSNSILMRNPVLSQANNVEIMSESPYITRWDFFNETGVGDCVYNETFDNGDYWDLYGVSQRTIHINQIPTDDAYVLSNTPNTNYGSATLIYLYDNGVTEEGFIKWEFPYLFNNYTTNSSFRYYGGLLDGMPSQFYIYETSDFDESTLTWNNKPATGSYLDTEDVSPVTDWYDANLGVPLYYYQFKSKNNTIVTIIYSSEHASNKPQIYHHLSKNYQGNSILYCQTNTTETLTLRSPDNLTLSLNSSQIIHIRFNTTSTNRIDFNLKNSGSILKSYILSQQGNTNFNTRDIYFSVDGNYSIDQLEFTGIFNDEKNLIVDFIEIYEEAPAIIIYLDPDGYKQFYLDQPVNWTVKIYEKDILVDTQEFTTSSELQTLFYYKIEKKHVYLTYYDLNNEYLDFNRYITYANFTLDETLFTDKRLTSNFVYVDVDTLIQFNIYDSFNVLIKEYETYEEDFIDITLDVYSLKIKNEITEISNYTIKNDVSDIIKSGNIYPEEIIEFSVAVGDYTFNYTNNENGQLYIVNIELNNHFTLTLNSTYYQVYFSIFNYDGLGISTSWFRFYINNERKDLGFNTLKQDTNNLKVLDFFNATLFNQDINLRGYTEYNIIVEVYTLIVMNNYTHSIIIEIERSDLNSSLKQVIPAQTGIPYRFLTNITYKIKCYYTNETFIEEKTVLLDKDPMLVSFGWYSTEVPAEPQLPSIDTSLIGGLVVWIVVLSLSTIILGFIIWHYKSKLSRTLRWIKEKRRRGDIR